MKFPLVALLLFLALIGVDVLAKQPDYNDIFFEHPSGEFTDSKQATTAAISQLYKYEDVERWLTLYAQGIGYRNYPVKIKKPYIAVDDLSISEILAESGIELTARKVIEVQHGVYDLSEFNEQEIGSIVYSIYINHYNVQPFSGDTFFAVAGEWI
ncbi:hypothetical protein TUM4438_44810 [Shewanella sairae]|uniref:DUF4019 domain-containing protein n=2 Tax=Shewanella sairae TaxID=190310 RepID=A0ABQ4PRN3_9GAMM|nr:hypothetical protein [Shewanella sairae]GIU52340.1 hypothetical protein TUM4438_44810 [Shewanella sairae]